MGPDAEVLSLPQCTREAGGLIAQAARTRRRQNFRQSAPPGQALDVGSCNIAAAKVDLQGLGGDRRSGQLAEPSPERPIDEPFLTPACRRAVAGAPIEAQAKQRSGVPARLDEAFRQELLVGCGNRGSRGSKLGSEGAGRRKLVARSVDAIIDLRLQCFIATFGLWHHFPVSDWPTNIALNWPFKVACVSPR